MRTSTRLWSVTRANTNPAGRSYPDWRDLAACRDTPTDLFFPEPVRGNHRNRFAAQVEAAKTLCDVCPVKQSCRKEHATERFGIWFGTTPEERGFTGSRGDRKSVPA